MTEISYTINPLTGRRIRVGGSTFNQLIYDAYDYINGELIRRTTAPPLAPRQYFYNTETDRLICWGSRRYYELIRAGWDIEDDYYLIPPWRSIETLAIIRISEAERRLFANQQNSPLSYEQIMDKYRDRLVDLNISLCRECFIPIKIEDGIEYCNDCQIT